MAEFIKQIKASNGTVYDINAKQWDGHNFSEITDLVHGVVDTYVIPTSKSSVSGYAAIVGATTAQVSTTKEILKSLVTNSPDDKFDEFGVGDMILMGATSDGTKNFDRWISSIDANGNITLDVLETQVAKHHHTYLKPVVSTTSAKVITSVKINSTTTSNVAYAGSAVTVVNGGNGDVVTSVVHDDKGTYNLAIGEGSSTSGYGHSHTVNAHKHTVSYTQTILSSTASAYTSLSTSSYTPHSHTIVSAAGVPSNTTAIEYVYDGGTDEFIKSLKDSDNINTGNASPTTTSNSTGLSTSTQTSGDVIGDIVKTTSSGAHTHTVTTTTDTKVVTGVTVATSVVTSVSISHTTPTVAGSVITSVSYSAPTESTVTSWTCSVDSSGILSFTPSTANRVKSVTVTTTSAAQSAGSKATINAPRSGQSYTSATVNTTGSAESSGAHVHGFSHVHAIPSHTHTVNSHYHTYVKTIVSETGNAYTSLSTSSYTPHTHGTKVGVAGIATNGTTFDYVYGGSQTSVVKDLTTSTVNATVADSSPSTNTVYHTLTGGITFPGLNVGTKSIASLLSTTTVKPAVDSGQKPAMSITITSANFINEVTVSDSTIKTTTNIGGE